MSQTNNYIIPQTSSLLKIIISMLIKSFLTKKFIVVGLWKRLKINGKRLLAGKIRTRPAWAGFKTAEEGRAKICKFLWQKLKNKSNIEKHIMNNFKTLLEQFYNSFITLL
jgi:hypothetical protein